MNPPASPGVGAGLEWGSGAAPDLQHGHPRLGWGCHRPFCAQPHIPEHSGACQSWHTPRTTRDESASLPNLAKSCFVVSRVTRPEHSTLVPPEICPPMALPILCPHELPHKVQCRFTSEGNLSLPLHRSMGPCWVTLLEHLAQAPCLGAI